MRIQTGSIFLHKMKNLTIAWHQQVFLIPCQKRPSHQFDALASGAWSATFRWHEVLPQHHFKPRLQEGLRSLRSAELVTLSLTAPVSPGVPWFWNRCFPKRFDLHSLYETPWFEVWIHIFVGKSYLQYPCFNTYRAAFNQGTCNSDFNCS